MEDSSTGRIVVGVNGSPASITALHWAANMAAARRRELVAVWVCGPRSTASYAPARPWHVDEQERARQALAAVVGDLVAALPAARVRQVSATGLPARVPLDQAQGAELLVLGSHRHQAVSSPAAGPVTLACLLCPPCPVVIVGPPDEPPPSLRLPAEAPAELALAH